MNATRILTDGEWFDLTNPGADFDAESPPCKVGCQCPICTGECPTCAAVGGLCINCDQHLAALADAYAA